MNTGSPLAGSTTGGGRPPVALIAGPTASGKSERAVELALALGERGIPAVIVNADSAQVYADLQILSARPDAAQMRGIPHRLFGHRDGAHPCSAADWAAEARAEIRVAHAAGAVPILVGGTGLYLRTLIDGIAPVPAIDPAIRTAVRALPVAEARARLAALDPQAAARLAPADVSRTARALEVVLATGRPLAHWQSARSGGIGTCVRLVARVLVPPRERLYERADSRFLQMLELGGEAEVAQLLDRGLDPALPVMRAIGVQEIAAWLNGHSSRDAMIAAGQQATRRYAKRQYTWFRNQPPQEWKRVHQDSGINEDVEIILRNSWLT